MASSASHRRHDISDRVWKILEPLLPGGKGKVGRPAQDNRRFLNAVFWILRTGAPWRDLPPGLRRLEEHPSPLFPLAGQWRLAEVAGSGYRRPRL